MAGGISTLEAAQQLQQEIATVEVASENFLRENKKILDGACDAGGLCEAKQFTALRERVRNLSDRLIETTDRTDLSSLATKENLDSLRSRVTNLSREIPGLGVETGNEVASILKDVTKRIKALRSNEDTFSEAKKNMEDPVFKRFHRFMKEALGKDSPERKTI